MVRILVIDNYGSFIYSIISRLVQIGADVIVWRNDDPRFVEPGWEGVFDGVLLSPGPGTPEHAGVCVEVIRRFGEHKPLLGVCPELQAMAITLDGVVDRAGELPHGKVSPVIHDGKGVFTGLPLLLRTIRYHSLAAAEDKPPEELGTTVHTGSGVIMAVRHREWSMEAVQFHPESVLVEGGHQTLANWLITCGDTNAPTRASGFDPLVAADVDL